jgi:hypothetical protein
MKKEIYQVRKEWSSEWVSFDTMKAATQWILKELHDVGFTLDSRGYAGKFEELTWIEKGRVITAD